MKRFIIVGIVVFMLIVSMLPAGYSGTAMLIDEKTIYICGINEQCAANCDVIDSNKLTNSAVVLGYGDEFGVWIYTKYNDADESIKLDIDLEQFSLMLKGGGWKDYKLTMENVDDTTARLQFVRTKIYLEDEDEFVDVVQTQFTLETMCDTTEDFEVSLEIRFPFSLLKSKAKSYTSFSGNFDNTKNNKIINILGRITDSTKSGFFGTFYETLINFFQRTFNTYANPLPANSESYFCARIGYASPENDEGPNRVETRFFFGRNKIKDPRVYRMNIKPYDLGREYKLSYFNSYLTVSESGSEASYRLFSFDFEPAAELQITSVPREAKISYNFGSSTGVSTKISFKAEGGALSDIIQSFTIDPLPEHMSFDLTVLGERSFKYESDQIYSVTYMMDSVEEGNLVKLELENLPKIITARWGLKLYLSSLSGSGFADLDMSSNIDRMALSLYDSDTPFIEINNFPQKLRVDGFIDVPNLQGSITASKSSGVTTTINVPLRFDKWEITGEIYIHNGYGYVSFNLPDASSDHVSVGFDTNNNALLGFGITVYDTEQDQQVLYVGVDAVATDDLYISFDYISSEIENLKWSGKITELIDLVLSVDFQGIGLDLSGSWTIGDYGLFEVEVNQELVIELDRIDLGNFEMDGIIGMYPGTTVSVEWQRGDVGYFKIETDGVGFNPEVEVTFYDKNSNEIFIYGNVVLNPSCILKFDWEWGKMGHFTVFTNDLVENINFEVGYGYDQSYDEYEYGFRINGTDISIIRTIQWDTENGAIPRIWVLGDDIIPGSWDVWLLWQYEWYEVK